MTLVGDAYEPDGSSGAATPIAVGAAAQQHTIEPYGDEDWVAFTVEAGRKYAIQTAPGASAREPGHGSSVLYDSDGTTQIGSNDDDDGSLVDDRLRGRRGQDGLREGHGLRTPARTP